MVLGIINSLEIVETTGGCMDYMQTLSYYIYGSWKFEWSAMGFLKTNPLQIPRENGNRTKIQYMGF